MAKNKIEINVNSGSESNPTFFCSATKHAFNFAWYKCTRCQEYNFKVRYDVDVPTLMYKLQEWGWLRFVDQKQYISWIENKIGPFPAPIPTPESSWVAVWVPGKKGTVSYSPMAFFKEDTEYIFRVS